MSTLPVKIGVPSRWLAGFFFRLLVGFLLRVPLAALGSWAVLGIAAEAVKESVDQLATPEACAAIAFHVDARDPSSLPHTSSSSPEASLLKLKLAEQHGERPPTFLATVLP